MRAVRRTAYVTFMFTVLLFGMGADGGVTDSSGSLAIIREFGFPVFVAVWFMWRVEKRMDRFTEVVQNLLTTITVMAKTVEALPPTTTATAQRRTPHPPEAA